MSQKYKKIRNLSHEYEDKLNKIPNPFFNELEAKYAQNSLCLGYPVARRRISEQVFPNKKQTLQIFENSVPDNLE